MDVDAILKTQMIRQADQSLTCTLQVANLQALGLAGAIYYGYRAWGPNWTFDAAWTPGSSAGIRDGCRFQRKPFQPQQTADRSIRSGEQSRSSDAESSRPNCVSVRSGLSRGGHRSFRAKGIVLDFPTPISARNKPATFKDEIIYEVHLRGLTKNDPSVPANLQGTYAGCGYQGRVSAGLGVTAVEFLPFMKRRTA